MRIDHIALWAQDIEAMRRFYAHYFGARSCPKYENPKTGFQSYFLVFDDGCRLEIMRKNTIPANQNDPDAQSLGLIHFAVSVGSQESVDAITKTLIADGFTLVSGPRWTGDGYYESCFYDPENNRVEICI